MALGYACEYDRVHMMYFLLEHGAEVQRPCEEPIIHRALASNNIEIIGTLIARGADIDAKNRFGYTPLVEAMFHDLTDVALGLLAAGESFLIFTHLGLNVSAKALEDSMEPLPFLIGANPYLGNILRKKLIINPERKCRLNRISPFNC